MGVIEAVIVSVTTTRARPARWDSGKACVPRHQGHPTRTGSYRARRIPVVHE